MINFAELQENVTSCLENQKIMSAQLLKLEQTVATLSTKAEVETMELRFQEELSKTLRAIERVDLAQSAASKVVEEMPSIQRDLMGRMTDLESRAAEQVSGLSTKLGGRVSQCESDMRTKVDRADFQKLAIEVDDRARSWYVRYQGGTRAASSFNVRGW